MKLRKFIFLILLPLFVILYFVALWVGFENMHLDSIPVMSQFLGVFFSEQVIILVILYIVWYITLQNIGSEKSQELKFLFSLPISDKRILRDSLKQNLFLSSWIPLASFLIYLSLYNVSPLHHLLKLSIVTFTAYMLVILFDNFLQIYITVKMRNSSRYNYPGRNHPIITALIINIFALIQLSVIVFPSVISNKWFVTTLVIQIALSYILFRSMANYFKKWRYLNLIYTVSFSGSDESIYGDGSRKNVFSRWRLKNPMLIKNYAKVMRKKSKKDLILSGIFMMVAFLLSANNPLLEDKINVLLVLSILFTFYATFKYINSRKDTLEEEKIFNSLPVNSLDIFYSEFLPMGVFLVVVNLIFSVMLFAKGAGAVNSTMFFAETSFYSIFLSAVAASIKISNHLDIEYAKKIFTLFMITAVIIAIVLYDFHMLIFSVYTIFSFVKLKKVTYFKTI